MDSNAWIAFGGLLIVVFLQSGGLAFFMGRLFQRVSDNRSIINEMRDGGIGENKAKTDLQVALARLDERMGHVEQGLKDLAMGIAMAPPPGYTPGAAGRRQKPRP